MPIDYKLLTEMPALESPLSQMHTGATIGTLLANTDAVRQATEQSAAAFPMKQRQAAATLDATRASTESTQQQMKIAQRQEERAERMQEFKLHTAELDLMAEKLTYANRYANAMDLNNDPDVVMPQWNAFRQKVAPLRIMPEEMLPEDATYNQMLEARRYIQKSLDADIPQLQKQTRAGGVFMAKLAEVEERFPDATPQEQYRLAAAYALSDQGISQSGAKTTVTTTAREEAKLQPGITTGKTKQIAIQTAIKVQQLKVDAANAALVALPPKDAAGKYDTTHLTPQVAYELAMACAKLVSPQGVVAQNTADELYQRTAKGDVSKGLAYLGIPGVKLGGTTIQSLENIENFIRREGGLAEKNREQMLKGNLPPLRTSSGGATEPAPGSAKPVEPAEPAEVESIEDLDLDAILK